MFRISNGGGGEKRLCVGVFWGFENETGRALLNGAAKIHHHDFIGDISHHGQIMADEQKGQIEPFLNFIEKVEILCLNGQVERGNRLVQHQNIRFQHQGAGNGDTLALAP